jgi:hypothetical protein
MRMERDGRQDDNDRLGRLIIQTLALLGGLAGLVIGALQLLASLVSLSSSHIPFGLSEMGLVAGAVLLLLGLDGMGWEGNSIHQEQEQSMAASPFLRALGFSGRIHRWIAPIGIGFLGWILRTPPGVLLTAAGLLAFITPERLRSLLGQGSKTTDTGPLGQALFVGIFLPE